MLVLLQGYHEIRYRCGEGRELSAKEARFRRRMAAQVVDFEGYSIEQNISQVVADQALEKLMASSTSSSL